jgi:hypothetical protein
MKYTLYSTSFLSNLTDESLGYIPHRVWLQRMDEGFDRLFANIQFQNGLKRICALQGIQEENIDLNGIYLPMWMIPHGIEIGDEVDLEILDKSAFVKLCLEENDVLFYVSRLEPANICLMDGEEVSIEFEESSDRWDGRPDTPPPPEPEVLIPPSGNSMLPDYEVKETKWVGQGHTLGGSTEKKIMPDGRPWNPWRESKLPQQKEDRK